MNINDADKVMQSLEDTANEIKKVKTTRETLLRATHGRFNIFTTLLKANDEVRLHTRYITHLLDPYGTHDCDRIFLDLFLVTIGLPHLKDQACIYVANEHYTGCNGNIDIYIEFESAALVIENKIEAKDQEAQLYRYKSYAETQKEKVHLFYLTLKGNEPSNISKAELKDDEYELISYKENILEWLELCLEATCNCIKINQALQQYKAVINELLNNTLEAKDMNELKDKIKANHLIMQNADLIIAALQDIKADKQNEFVSLFTKNINANHYVQQWPMGTALKLYSTEWGPKDQTELCVLMANSGGYLVKAYDVPGGRLEKVINSMYQHIAWGIARQNGSNYVVCDVQKFDFPDDALRLLKNIISSLES